MSSLVHAKCTNSSTRSSSAHPLILSFNTYSTAFTSWFVVLSTVLTFSASSTAKPVARSSRIFDASAENGGTSTTPGMVLRCWSQRHSTAIRYRIKPYLEVRAVDE